MVRLVLPADHRFVRVARLAAAGVAVPAGFAMDDVEDLTIAVDELTSTLIEAGGGDTELDLELTVGNGAVSVTGQVPLVGPHRVDPERRRLSEEILGAVTAEHEVVHADGVLRARVVCRRRGPRADLN